MTGASLKVEISSGFEKPSRPVLFRKTNFNLFRCNIVIRILPLGVRVPNIILYLPAVHMAGQRMEIYGAKTTDGIDDNDSENERTVPENYLPLRANKTVHPNAVGN